MIGREILIVALAAIANEGYVSKSMSRGSIDGKRATSDIVADMFRSTTKATPDEELRYGSQADEIINWAITYRGTDEFYLKCKGAFKLAQTNIAAAVPYLCALPSVYDRISEIMELRDIVTTVDPFLGQSEETLDDVQLKTFCIRIGAEYNTVKMLDSLNRLYVGYINKTSKICLDKLSRGDIVLVSGKLTNRINENPPENRIKIKKLIKKDCNDRV